MRQWTHRAGKGFTLIELMITVVIVAIGVALAVPSWENMLQKRNLTSGAEEIASFLTYTQSEAIKQNQEVTVTITKSGAGINWCVGAVNESVREAAGIDHCECTETDPGDSSYCNIDGLPALLTRAGTSEKIVMVNSYQGGTDNSNMNFNFDPVRGIKIADDGTVDTNDHSMTLASINGKYRLGVGVAVNGRVRICSPIASKAVPGFKTCTSDPITIPAPP